MLFHIQSHLQFQRINAHFQHIEIYLIYKQAYKIVCNLQLPFERLSYHQQMKLNQMRLTKETTMVLNEMRIRATKDGVVVCVCGQQTSVCFGVCGH